MICENNIECMFDLAATGSEEFGLNTLNHHKRFNVTMDQLSKFNCISVPITQKYIIIPSY